MNQARPLAHELSICGMLFDLWVGVVWSLNRDQPQDQIDRPTALLAKSGRIEFNCCGSTCQAGISRVCYCVKSIIGCTFLLWTLLLRADTT